MLRTLRPRPILLLVALLLVVFAPPATADDMSESELQEMYVEYLESEGYRPEVDDDGDVMFKREGGTYYIIVHETDSTFFQVVYPNFWEIESDEERAQAMVACDDVNRRAKVAKLYLIRGENVWCSAELFLAQPRDFEGVFSKCMQALEAGVDMFVGNMRD